LVDKLTLRLFFLNTLVFPCQNYLTTAPYTFILHPHCWSLPVTAQLNVQFNKLVLLHVIFLTANIKSISAQTYFIYFIFRTTHFVLCLGITNKCINSYQFIISLSWSYMFRHQGASELHANVRQGTFNELLGDILHATVATTGSANRTAATRTETLVCNRQHRQTDRYAPGCHIVYTPPHTTQVSPSN
jgi:hypothetical protein